MKNISRLVLLLSLAFGAVVSARATSFDFSYTFGDGLVVTGSLDGTANGQFVDNVSNVSLFFNGNAATGPIFTATFDGTSFTYLAGAVVSFDSELNNFIFVNDDIANGGGNFDSYFIMTDAANNFGTSSVGAASTPFGYLGSGESPIVAANWSLTAATSTNVPDGGTTAGLLGLSTLVLVALRRRR